MESLEWTREDPMTIHKVGGYRTLVEKTFVLPDGERKSFVTKDAEGAAAVAVIGLTEHNKILVVNIFRPGPEIIMQEIPGGGVEKGEDLEQAARREFLEETGHAIGSVAYLGFSRYDAYTNGKRHYFLWRDCYLSEEGQKLDAEEHLTVEEVPISQLIDNAQQGRMTDPGAVLMAYDTLREIERL
jgi:ADP-ribose pyrophosphatase